jgi:CRISPR/Cas system CSM-associated protein Csm3 (group 7 of RAMP superfamily)
MVKNMVENDEIMESMEDEMRKTDFQDSGMRKTEKCANLIEITFICELEGYDIKTLNSSTGKGSYLLKVGERTVTIPYTSARKELEKNFTLTLYKIKGLRGFLRRAAELRLLKLKAAGQIDNGPCTPTSNYPHQEILDKHIAAGYHQQGTCHPMCMVRRLYGSLENFASVKIFPPFIAKCNAENIPSPVNQYLNENIGSIFGLDHCIVYHNGESTLKTETFNIINRVTELAVNNFMKHTTSGQFPFKVVFRSDSGSTIEMLENIGFFIASLFEINSGNVQIGADKSKGSGQVKIKVKDIILSNKFPEVEEFVKAEEKKMHLVEFGDLRIQEETTAYSLDPSFGDYALKAFTTILGQK